MPEIGEKIKDATGHWRIWVKCSQCGKEEYKRTDNLRTTCTYCVQKLNNSGSNNPNWKGGSKASRERSKKLRTCSMCGEATLVFIHSRAKERGLPVCYKCRPKLNTGERCSNWKGGKSIAAFGYIRIKLKSTDPYYSMAEKTHHYVFEHRLVMAKHLGRPLLPLEKVHHRGIRHPLNSIENRQDNKIDNLELTTNENHYNCTINDLTKRINQDENIIKEDENIIKEMEKTLQRSAVTIKMLEGGVHSVSSFVDKYEKQLKILKKENIELKLKDVQRSCLFVKFIEIDKKTILKLPEITAGAINTEIKN